MDWLTVGSLITTRNNYAIKSIFSTNVYHVHGLCLLGIGGSHYISHKLLFENCIFTFSTSSLKQPAGGTLYYYTKRLPKIGNHSLLIKANKANAHLLDILMRYNINTCIRQIDR